MRLLVLLATLIKRALDVAVYRNLYFSQLNAQFWYGGIVLVKKCHGCEILRKHLKTSKVGIIGGVAVCHSNGP